MIQKEIRWSPPANGWIKLNIDGALVEDAVDTQFRDSWMSMRQRTPMMRKTMNRSRIFEIGISFRA